MHGIHVDKAMEMSMHIDIDKSMDIPRDISLWVHPCIYIYISVVYEWGVCISFNLDSFSAIGGHGGCCEEWIRRSLAVT